MDRLASQVEDELGRLTPAGAADMAAIVRVWPDAVGAENARRCWPARLSRDGTLHVHAADSIWAFQLGMLADEILARLREHLGGATPPKLRFVAGPLPEPARGESPQARLESRAPAPADVAEASALVAAIDDDELRATVARAAAASLSRARLEPRSDRRF